MANTHINQSTKERLLKYCSEDELTVTQGVDSLLSKVAALEKESEYLSKIVTMYETAEYEKIEKQ